MTYADIQTQALAMGITTLHGKDLTDYARLSDGCSGRLSWIYAMAGRTISCHRCCVVHDWLYDWGGTDADRKKADKLLRWCAARAGSFEGWQGPFRRAWRTFRAWIMYAGVRMIGRRYWAGVETWNLSENKRAGRRGV